MADTKVPKVISISAKCSDCFSMNVMDKEGNYIADYDGYVPSFMPNGGGYGDYVQMKIDLETGEILDWTNPIGNSEFDDILKDADKKVPKVISISAHCRDMFDMSVMDAKGNCIADYDGYVPSFMPNGGGYGDAVEMDIDIETRRILDWTNPIGTSEFNAILEGRDEDDEDDD